MNPLIVGLLLFAAATHGTSTLGASTNGDLLVRLRVANELLRPFDHPLVLGIETGMYRAGSVYTPGIGATLEVQILKF